MRIALDAHTIGTRKGGNETYIRGLIRGLAAVDTKNDYLIYVMHPEAAARDLDGLPSNFRFREIQPKVPLLRIPFSLPLALARDRAEAVLLQYVSPPLCPAKVVLMVHDLSYVRYPDHFTRLERLRMAATTPFSARRAARVITVSTCSKRDIVDLYRFPPERVTVIYNGLSEVFRRVESAEKDRVRGKYKLPERFILYVGNIQPRKNLVRLIEAFVRLKREGGVEQKLVIVGNRAWLTSGVFRAARESGLESEILFTGYVPEEDLPALYGAADLFVYPSIFEGFGLPVAEAMACGAPVITSNTSSLPEVAGEAAVLVDPLSVEEIAGAIRRVLADAGLREDLARRGPIQAARFRWEEAARQTLRVFEEAVQ